MVLLGVYILSTVLLITRSSTRRRQDEMKTLMALAPTSQLYNDGMDRSFLLARDGYAASQDEMEVW